MAKRKPKQPHSANMAARKLLPYPPTHNGHSSAAHSTESGHASTEVPPHNPCQDSDESGPHHWSSSEATNEAYARLDNTMRDFVYGISRGYSVRHSCRMAGEDYERMLDYLNKAGPYFKPDLLRLVDKARAVAYARQVEKLNAASDWHAAAFWLERREREFAPPRLGRDPEEHQERKALVMTPEAIEALSAAYDAANGNIREERDTDNR